jgi:uncharacterized protein (TIGR03083 family)
VDLDAYRGVRDRVAAVVLSADAGTPVPCCPDWRVRDVVAHLAGLCEDWVDHRLEGYASEPWTAAQVDRFSACDVGEILERWDRAMGRFAALDDDPMMGPPARWAFGDAVIHEADIRGALGAPRVPDDAVRLALKGAVARWRQVLAAAEAPTLLLRAPDAREWWLGTPDGAGAVTVTVAAFDVFRGLAGRRSADQVRGWAWSSDPEPYLRAGLPYPFQSAAADIVD